MLPLFDASPLLSFLSLVLLDHTLPWVDCDVSLPEFALLCTSSCIICPKAWTAGYEKVVLLGTLCCCGRTLVKASLTFSILWASSLARGGLVSGISTSSTRWTINLSYGCKAWGLPTFNKSVLDHFFKGLHVMARQRLYSRKWPMYLLREWSYLKVPCQLCSTHIELPKLPVH